MRDGIVGKLMRMSAYASLCLPDDGAMGQVGEEQHVEATQHQARQHRGQHRPHNRPATHTSQGDTR